MASDLKQDMDSAPLPEILKWKKNLIIENGMIERFWKNFHFFFLLFHRPSLWSSMLWP